MNSRCYLCLKETKYSDALLCTNCFCHLQDYQWLGCARCGQLSCGGCDKLSQFHKVESAYIYKDILPQILILAKEENNLNAQKVFHELFFVPIKNRLLQFILQKNYDLMIVAPLRLERMLYGMWHPNLFYEEVLGYLFENELQGMPLPKVLYPYFTKNKKKQSFIPSMKREKIEQQDFSIHFMGEDLKHITSYHKILLLDDVLTSGTTALLCQRFMRQKLETQDWDLFTILRAPKS